MLSRHLVYRPESISGSLPHPVFEGTQKIAASQAADLSHMGITTEHTVLDVVRAAAKIHPQLKLRTF
jgi:hypothetical protein